MTSMNSVENENNSDKDNDDDIDNIQSEIIDPLSLLTDDEDDENVSEDVFEVLKSLDSADKDYSIINLLDDYIKRNSTLDSGLDSFISDTTEREILENEIGKIHRLDESIKELEMKLKEVSEELSHLQIENREKLNEVDTIHPDKSELSAECTHNFLNLYSSEDDKKKYTLESKAQHAEESLNSIKQNLKDQLTRMENINSHFFAEDSPSCSRDEFSLTDDEKRQVENMINDVNLEDSRDLASQSNDYNPYLFDDESQRLLEELNQEIEGYKLANSIDND